MSELTRVDHVQTYVSLQSLQGWHYLPASYGLCLLLLMGSADKRAKTQKS